MQNCATPVEKSSLKPSVLRPFSLPLLAISVDEIFKTRELFRPYWPTRMHLARRDPDFGTHSKLTAI